MAASWQASRSAIESAWPRTIAASSRDNRRGGSDRRALPPARPGRSAAKATSTSGWRAIARRQPVTARLNGSVGASLAGALGLMLEDIGRSRAERYGLNPSGANDIHQLSATLTELSGNSCPKQR